MRHNDLSKELSLIILLSNNRAYTIKQICNRLSISLRSAYYYISFLRQYGFIIEKNGNNYSIDKSSPFFVKLLRKVNFTDDEATFLHRLLEKADARNWQVQHLKRKIESLYHLDILPDVELYNKEAQCASVLFECIRNQKMALLINYSSSHSNSVRSRLVEPFMFLEGNREVRCYEISSNTNKTFKISRIEEVKILADDWIHSAKHRKIFTDVFMFSGENLLPVELRLNRLSYNLLIEEQPRCIPYITQDGENHWIFRADVCSFLGIGRFVLGLCDNIEVLGSKDFISWLGEKITSSYKQFK